MPLRRADLRLVTVKKQITPDVCAADETPLFAEAGASVAATLQPLTGQVEAAVYGEEAARMLLMLTQSPLAFAEGMGVCVDSAGGACDYRVAKPPERWRGHARLVLKRL